MTSSGNYIYSSLTKFSKALPFISPAGLSSAVQTLCQLDKYFYELSSKAEKSPLQASKLKEYLAKIANAKYISENLLSTILQNSAIEGAIFKEQVQALQKRISLLYEDIKNVYAKRSALDIINCKLHWHDKTSYVELTVDDCGVSSKFLRLLSHLNGVTQEIILALGPDTAKEIMRNFIQQIFSEMSNGPFWADEITKTKEMFSPEGLQQFLVDFKFSEEGMGSFLSQHAQEEIRGMRNRAISNYCSFYKISDPSKAFSDREVHRIVKAAIEQKPTLIFL